MTEIKPNQPLTDLSNKRVTPTDIIRYLSKIEMNDLAKRSCADGNQEENQTPYEPKLRQRWEKNFS